MYEAKFLEVPLDIFKYGPVKGSTVFNVMRGLGGLYLLAAQVEYYEYYECIHSIAVYSKLHILYKHNLCAYSMMICQCIQGPNMQCATINTFPICGR